MAALLPDFEYDIFVSYRHNDKEWVADFIPRLQDALGTVIKDKLNIYYDADPKDGLGDTYQVKASLDHRVLNSIILLSVISLTYCDTQKYSWGSEFLPFLEQAKANHLGLELTLPNGGNVVSRVLPLRIHNLEPEDTQLLERTLGGFLRSIDFVREGLGINRPLRAKDDDSFYSDQISKVANAIKELLKAAKAAQSGAHMAAPPPTPSSVAPTATPLPAAPAGGAAAPTCPVVFLAWASKELKARREELALICAKAGFNVVPATDCPTDEAEFRRRTQQALASADCALHLLGNKFGNRLEDNDDCSFSKYAYDQARLQGDKQLAFRQFVWYTPDEALPIDSAQKAFVDTIRNEQTERCTFSSAQNAPELVEELRSTLKRATPPPANEEVAMGSDIYFVYNDLDSDEANAITSRLGNEFMVESLIIKPDSEESAKTETVRAIPQSKLAVVYFKHSADWALPFVKQVWRLVGGAASTTQILLVGDPEEDCLHKFQAPKVVSSIKPHLSVSEEVQRVFQLYNPPA